MALAVLNAFKKESTQYTILRHRQDCAQPRLPLS